VSNESSIKIGELLVRAGVVTGVDLSEAEKLAKHMQVQFGRILIMSGCLTEHDLECALEAQVLIKQGALALEVACDALALASREQIPFGKALEQTHVPEPAGDHTLAMAELLADAEIVSPDELEAALDASLESHLPLAEVLISSNVISPLVEAIVEEMLGQLKKGERSRDDAIAEIRKTFAVWKRAEESLKSDEDSLPSITSLVEMASPQAHASPAAPRDPRMDGADESPLRSDPYIPGGYGTMPPVQPLSPQQMPMAHAHTPEQSAPSVNLPAAPKFQSAVLGYQLRPEDAPQSPPQPAPGYQPQNTYATPNGYSEQPSFQQPPAPPPTDDHLSIHQILSSYSSEILDDTGPGNAQKQTAPPVEWLQNLLATAQGAPSQPAAPRQGQSADTWHLVPPEGHQAPAGKEGWKSFDGAVPWQPLDGNHTPPAVPPNQANTDWSAHQLEHPGLSESASQAAQTPHGRVHSRHMSEQHLPLVDQHKLAQERAELERLENEKKQWEQQEALRQQQKELERLQLLEEAERERQRLEAERLEWERQQAEAERQRVAEKAAAEERELRRLAEQAIAEERERVRLAEQAAAEERERSAQIAAQDAERERQRVAEQRAAEEAERAQERLIAEAAERAERERQEAEEAERAREQERLIANAAERAESERAQQQANDEAAVNKVNALARLRPTNPQIIAQARQSGASLPPIQEQPLAPPSIPQAENAAAAPAAKPKVQGGKTLELETPHVKRAPVARTAPIIELLQSAGAFTTGELGSAVARALADQDRAGELVRLLGLVTRELVDAAGTCCKAISDEQLTYDQARTSILAVKAGKSLKEAMLEAGMPAEAVEAVIPDTVQTSAFDESDSPAVDDAMDLGSSEPSPGPLTLDDLDLETPLSARVQSAGQENPVPVAEETQPADSHSGMQADDDQLPENAASMVVPVIDESQHALEEVDPVASAVNEWKEEEKPIVFAPEAQDMAPEKQFNPFSNLKKPSSRKAHVIVASDSSAAIHPVGSLPEERTEANNEQFAPTDDVGEERLPEELPQKTLPSETADAFEPQEEAVHEREQESSPIEPAKEEAGGSEDSESSHEEQDTPPLQPSEAQTSTEEHEQNGSQPPESDEQEQSAPARGRKGKKAERSVKAKKPTKKKR
jgi:hypothetical protein